MSLCPCAVNNRNSFFFFAVQDARSPRPKLWVSSLSPQSSLLGFKSLPMLFKHEGRKRDIKCRRPVCFANAFLSCCRPTLALEIVFPQHGVNQNTNKSSPNFVPSHFEPLGAAGITSCTKQVGGLDRGGRK